jgi:CHAD domain-containing protein
VSEPKTARGSGEHGNGRRPTVAQPPGATRSAQNGDGPGDLPVEVELKFQATGPADLERILAAERLGPFRAVSEVITTDHRDRYVDTDDGALRAAGYAARIRSTEGTRTVTVKSVEQLAGGAAQGLDSPAATSDLSRRPGPVRRIELEGAATAGKAKEWPASAARSLILELCGDKPLRTVVALSQRRRRRDLRADDDSRAELSADVVSVLKGGQTIGRFWELEVELKEGEVGRLEVLAEWLGRRKGLAPSRRSKLESALLATQPPSPSPAASPSPRAKADGSPPRTPGVRGDDTMAEAGRKVIGFQLRRMAAKETGTRAGHDNEELHGMRVATRRLRAAWRIFGDAFVARKGRRQRRALRDVAARLGEVRDLDVLLDGAAGYLASLEAAQAAGLEPLLAEWRTRRDEAREQLIEELDSPRYLGLVDGIRAFLEDALATRPTPPLEPHRVRDSAPSRIWNAFEKVRAYEAVLRYADVETLHQLRIAAKWLRYSIEFVREPLGDEAGDVVQSVVALQDHLGMLHDADVAANLIRTYLVEQGDRLGPEEIASISRYLVDREREIARLRGGVGRPWRGVVGPRSRRRLGRALAEL